MSKAPITTCPNCGNENLAGYQDKQICNVCGWRSDRPDATPVAPAPAVPAEAAAPPAAPAAPAETLEEPIEGPPEEIPDER